jgi:rhamnogalacturonyl hydrolase YesR
MRRLTATLLCLVALSVTSAYAAQANQATPQEPLIGDAPADPGPLASNLSQAFKLSAIQAAMRKVADWQSARIIDKPSRDWPFAILYDGLLSASVTLNEPGYHDLVVKVAEHYDWALGAKAISGDADDETIAQSYLWLYREHPDARRIQPLRVQFDRTILQPDDPAKPVWWWSYALYMGPPVWSALAATTHDSNYLDHMDREWKLSSNLLWDPQEHLLFRDSSYFDKREKNGRKMFLSRANGWVMGGLVRVLDDLPAGDPRRPFYEDKLRTMAETVARFQCTDGLWRPGLLDPEDYPYAETSGSAFFVYALAWGINHHVLSAKRYRPVVKRAWAGLITHIYADGRLGCIQPVNAALGAYTPGASSVYGVGSFLLAGAEVYQLAARGH